MAENKKLTKAKERLESAKKATYRELRFLKTAWVREPNWNGTTDTTIKNLRNALSREDTARKRFGEAWKEAGYPDDLEFDKEVLEVFGF